MRGVVPGTAANNAKIAVATNSRHTIARVAGILFIPAILGPFPYVAMHVVETPRIGGETVDGHRPLAPHALEAARIRDVAIIRWPGSWKSLFPTRTA